MADLFRPKGQDHVRLKRWIFSLGVALLALLVGREVAPGFFLFSWGSSGAMISRELPEFPRLDAGQWLNSAPLTTRQLRGDVVLLDVWTFG